VWLWPVDGEISLAVGFRGVHGQVRTLKQGVGGDRVGLRPDDDESDTGVDRIPHAGEGARRTYGVEDAPANGCGVVCAVVEEDRELVTTHPGDRVRRPDAVGEPPSDGAQQLVADGVAESVVDTFEIVEVAEQQRQ
jgi:hypothetical protein